jgi:enediyne biosynthesis protein E4
MAVRYVDITKQAGIHFIHNNGAFGKKYLPESMGPGCAFLDYNNDGHQDILLINSKDWPDHPQKPSYPALYKNNGNGTFTDVTKEAGLQKEMYGIGVTVGDYDNDGNEDIYITTLDSDHLFHNTGKGTFEDVSAVAGISDSEFGTSATWFDYDRDGFLDLYVCNYVQWSPAKDLFCTLDGVNKSYCTPESYAGASPILYRNKRDGTFENATRKAGLFDPTSKALGVIAVDYDQDGWPDLFVANDTQPNRLYHNNQDGTFTDKAVPAGVAFSEAGVARAGMGVDAADYDGSGFPALLVGNFSNEMIGLYHNEGTGVFIDEAPATTIGQASLLTLAFGVFFFDFDLDGHPDIFAANGHVHDDINRVQQQVTYAEPPHLFRNLGDKKFQEVTRTVGSDLVHPVVARGAAYADFDNDGDLDILVATNDGPAYLFRNDGGSKHHFIRIRLKGTKSNKDGIGAKIILHLPDGKAHWQSVKSGSSYCSQSEIPVTFGLGDQTSIKGLEVDWPSGVIQKLENPKIDQLLLLLEPSR